MRTAVVRVIVDADGVLSGQAYETGVGRLRELGHTIIAAPVATLPEKNREVEVIAAAGDLDRLLDNVLVACSRAFGAPAIPGVVTYISRGTDDDALGILGGFGIDGRVSRVDEGEEELVTVTVNAPDLRRVPESRLHTALEAALNCEVRIVVE